MSLEASGFVVDEAEDGEHGSYLAKVNNYDLIILDYILPNRTGKQVCEEIRSAGKSTPILLLSGKQDVLSKITLLESGADDYLTKPFSFGELKARIQALLRRPKQIQSTIYKIGDISVNLDTHEVLKNRQKINLTRKEFLLLALLCKNQGNVVSRADIFEHVWDSESDPFSNSLETHILNLRKKIGDTKKFLIRSVSGCGYKICTTQNI
jgi:DNA-binding response OmpR family regulator